MSLFTLTNPNSDGSGASTMATVAMMASQITGLNLNTTGDVASVITGLPARFVIASCFLSNFSTTPSVLLAATLRDTASAGGNSLVGPITGLNAIVTSTTQAMRAVSLTTALAAQVANTTGKLYFNVSVANGSALTADLSLVILPLP